MLRIIKDNLSKLKIRKKHYKKMMVFFSLFVVGGLFLGMQKTDASVGETAANIVARVLLTVGEIFMRLGLWELQYVKAIAVYNNFMDAPPVVLGWLMVRDIANMFFVVVLLVIAFATVLGLEQYEWKRSLIKLVLAAIFINFSKTILQLIIDAAQVVTLTFYNAFADASGGNFINMFKLDSITKMIAPDYIEKNVTEKLAWQTFAASVMMVIMAGITMVTIFAYLVILIARVVMLWILMVLSPLAFILQTIPSGKQYADQFWQKFIHHVLVAPVMFFFLWLAFATLGSGNIAAQIGINTSQVNQAGIGTEELPSNPSITSSVGTTWENLSSFAMAIGFMIAGLTFIQGLGVVGGGLTQKAQQFGMSVATIASGYAAGRWLVGKGKEVGTDYGRLAWGATGEKVLNMPYVKKIPIIGGAAGVGRKEAVKRLETLQQARKARYEAEGPKGVAGWIAPKKEAIAGLEAETEQIKGTKEAQYKAMKAQAEQKLFRDDLGQFYGNKEKQIKATLGIDIKEKYGDDYKKLQEHIKNKDYSKAEGSMGSIEEELEKEAAKKDKIYDRREIDRKSAIGTHLVGRHLEERYAEEEAGTATARRDTIKGAFGHSYLKEESEKLENAKVAVDQKLIENKKNELYLEHAATEKFKKSDESKWQTMDAEKRQELVAGNIKSLSNKEKEQLIDGVKADEVLRNEIDKKAADSVSREDKARAYEKEGIYEKFAIVGGLYETAKSQRRINKFKTILEKETASAKDVERGNEGKTTDNERRWEANKAAESLTETSKMPMEDLMADITQKNLKIKEINVKEASGTMSNEEKKIRENLIQTQTALIASLVQTYTGMSASFLAGLDDSYKDVKVNSRENVGRVMVGAIMGKKWDEVKDDNGLTKVAGDMQKNLKDKEKWMMRTLNIATKRAADNGFTQFYQQVAEGVDQNGNKKMGFAPIMKAGLGNAEQLGTGKLKNDKGDEFNGKLMQVEAERGMYLPGVTRHSAKDARAFMVHDDQGRSLDYQGEEQLRAVRSFANATKKEIEDRSLNDFNIMSGGSWGNSTWNGKTEEFDFSTNAMREGMALQLSDLITRYNSTKGDVPKNDVLAVGRLMLQRYGVDKINGKNTTELTARDIADFINKKVTGIENETQRGAQKRSSKEIVYGEERTTAKAAKDLKMVKIEEDGSKKENKNGGNSGSDGSGERDLKPSSAKLTSKPEPTSTLTPKTESVAPTSPLTGAGPKITQAPDEIKNVLKEIKNTLSNFSAELGNIYANMPQMSPGEETRLKGIVADKGGHPRDEQNALVDYNLGKTIAEAVKGNNEGIRNEVNAKIDAIKDSTEKNDMMGLLTKTGSLEEADIIKLGRVFRQALESVDKGNKEKK